MKNNNIYKYMHIVLLVIFWLSKSSNQNSISFIFRCLLCLCIQQDSRKYKQTHYQHHEKPKDTKYSTAGGQRQVWWILML